MCRFARRLITWAVVVALVQISIGAMAAVSFDDVVPLSDQAWELLCARLFRIEEEVGDRFPHVTEKLVWRTSKSGEWTGGFYPGMLWLAEQEARRRGDTEKAEVLRQKALQWSERLAPRQFDTGTHDLGFLFVPTWVEAYSRTGDERWRNGALNAARSLSKRFAPGGFIQSWGPIGQGPNAGTVIIDNMMNLELLYWAAEELNDDRLAEMATSHALLTQRHHVRQDGGSYHLVDFVRNTGARLRGRTHQGFSANSTWSRGQAWGIAGFAITYQYTGNPGFLETAQEMGEFFMHRLPEDGAAPWDFDAPAPAAKDTSANAIAAYGFLCIARHLRQERPQDAAKWVDRARYLLQAIHSYSLFAHPELGDKGGLLTGGTYNFKQGSAVEQSVAWGDYYYLRSLLGLAQWEREQD
ncbi:MAG: glycoside hydrolase family 88 protein [Limnochordia bacterium]